MDLEINPFETIGLAPHPHQEPIDCYHNLEKLLTIIETQPERKNWTKRVRRFFPKRTRGCHTNACDSTFHFNPGHHCRLCKNIVCDECFMHVPERIVDTLHRQKGQGNLNNKNIKVCQACNERVKEEWLLYSIDIPDGVSIQKLDALKQKAEYRIQNYNTAVREVRERTRLYQKKRLHQMRDRIDSILDEYDETLHILVQEGGRNFEEYRTDLDRLKGDVSDGLTSREKCVICVCRCFYCCCCCCCNSTEYDYRDDTTYATNV